MSRREVAVIGAGLTGLTAAHCLAEWGIDVTVYERDFVLGGHARNEWIQTIPYEPHGAHIFHTSDPVVWQLVTSLIQVLPYRHRVMTELNGEMFSWPLQASELDRLDEYSQILDELDALLPSDVDEATNFEEWCIALMGPTLYGLFIEGYTQKQWGRAGRQLSKALGPKRVELRQDGYRDLFRDEHQGWADYAVLAEKLAGNHRVLLGQEVTLDELPDLVPPDVPVIVTSALDDFCCDQHGPLEWRGVRVTALWMPDVHQFQPAAVVNRPSLSIPYTRTIESKWVLGEPGRFVKGTIVMYEYPGAATKHYPVLDSIGRNAVSQSRYELSLARYQRNPITVAGRLGRYTYINMDEAMREGMDAARRVASHWLAQDGHDIDPVLAEGPRGFAG